MPQIRNLEIFRPGTFTSMDGRETTFSESQLNEVAESYNPKLFKSPLTIGHPKDNKPHLGDVLAIYMHNNRLSVAAEFSDALFEGIQSGAYKNRSASFYLPESPGNPTPGRFYLRHVGFLGAVPPAVKGLSPLNFTETDRTAPVDFASTLTPVSFSGIHDCDTSRSFPVRQPDGSIKQAFLWRGQLLYLNNF